MLVPIEADAVAEAVCEKFVVRAVTAIDDDLACSIVDRAGKTAGTGCSQRRILRFAHQLKSPRDFFARLAVDAGSRDVGSVAFHSASTIDQDDVAFL